MKRNIVVLMAAGLGVMSLYAADEGKAVKDVLHNVEVSAGYAMKFDNLVNGPDHGVTTVLGLPINHFVTLQAELLSWESDWGSGPAISEVGLSAKANFVTGMKERLHLYGIAGGGFGFSDDNWNLGVGLGLQYNFTKRIALVVDGRVRPWFKGDRDEDLLICPKLNIKF